MFVTNVVRCRPPGNRDPQPDEIEACRGWLESTVDLVEPRVIATLGNFATKLLTGNPAGITKVRGSVQVHELGHRTVFLMPLFHPAAALRTPSLVETLREDFAKLPDLLERDPGAHGQAGGIGCRRGARRCATRRSARLLRLTQRTTSAAETEGLGARVAGELVPGDVVLVSGELGAGKTTFVRGACRALGIEGPVVSPTFTIGRRYDDGRVPISHLDLYRLEGLGPEEPGLLEDYLTADAVSFVEWPAALEGEFAPEALAEGVRLARRVELRHAGGDERDVIVGAA